MERSHGRITVKGSDAKLMWGRRGNPGDLEQASSVCLVPAEPGEKLVQIWVEQFYWQETAIVSQGRYSSEFKEIGFEGGECHSLNVVY